VKDFDQFTRVVICVVRWLRIKNLDKTEQYSLDNVCVCSFHLSAWKYTDVVKRGSNLITLGFLRFVADVTLIQRYIILMERFLVTYPLGKVRSFS